jgi:hypothetical protein
LRISEIRNPDLFQSLCQQLLVAEYPDTQIVDDSSGDRGIDAYVPSTRTLYAMYCPEKTPTPKKYFQDKIRDDVEKAVNLRDKLGYDISHWIFLTPTPLAESLHRDLKALAQQSGFMSGANQAEAHLTNLLAKHRHVRSVFSQLITPDLEAQLEKIHVSLSSQIREQQFQSPTLEIQFAELKRRKPLGQIVDLESEIIELPDESAFPLNRGNMFDFRLNDDYWWEKAVFLRETAFIRELGLVAKNASPTAAKNVRAQIMVNKLDGAKMLGSSSYPSAPQSEFGVRLFDYSRLVMRNSKSVEVDEFDDRWLISADFGTVQPRGEEFSDYTFLVGALIPCTLNLEATVRADNLPEPSVFSLVINISTRRRSLSVKEVVDYQIEGDE